MSAPTTDPTAEQLRSQLWRMRNLYSCRIEGVGQSVKFKPRPEQEILLDHLINRPTVPIYVIKSRRLGISTLVDTFACDCATFRQGFRGIIIDQKQADATKKMVEIVRFAYDSLPATLRAKYHMDKRNDGELRVRLKGQEENTDSVVFATTGGRGGDCSMLHVSEWGPISATDPTRSNEIRTGAFPAARKGIRVVETTWYGGKGGDLWDLVKPILERDPNGEGVLYFFPWWTDPEAIRIDGHTNAELEKYFRELQKKLGAPDAIEHKRYVELGSSFSPGQKNWFAAKKVEQGIFIKREYPSTLEEAFSAPVEGSIYGDAIMQLRGAGRVLPFEWDRGAAVFAFWDIGWDDSTSIWLVQQIGRDLHWIWHTRQRNHTAAQMALELAKSGIAVTAHFVPHDAGARKPGDGLNYMDSMRKAGLESIKLIPPCSSVWPGINALRDLLPRSFFRMPFCEDGLSALESYHTKKGATGIIKEDPVHDWSSHDSDAARYVAEALELGMVSGAAARRLVAQRGEVNPLPPPGEAPEAPGMSNVDHARQIRQQRAGRGRALSGHSGL